MLEKTKSQEADAHSQMEAGNFSKIVLDIFRVDLILSSYAY